MTATLHIPRSGPGVTVQDLGRPGYLAQGLSRGGAADPIALAEGAALLGQAADLPALEMAGAGIELDVDADIWIALTGAPMRAGTSGGALRWNASHRLVAGDRLQLGPARQGNFGYLQVAGGLDLPLTVGGRGAHLAAGLGAALTSGARLATGGAEGGYHRASVLPEPDRFSGGIVRILPGPQTRLFPEAVIDRFLSTRFTRTAHGNRQGVRLGFDGPGFRPDAGLSLVSEVIVPGDVQITGDGTPYVLGPECQTIGGYPRIGTVLPQDLPRVMQATPGSTLRFAMVTAEAAMADYLPIPELVHRLSREVRPLQRDLHHVPDLLSFNFISGVTAGTELSEPEEDP